jgi:hypothetical protein
MNIEVDRDQFLSELYYLPGVAGARQMIPVLSHLLSETAPGKITMRASDLRRLPKRSYLNCWFCGCHTQQSCSPLFSRTSNWSS